MSELQKHIIETFGFTENEFVRIQSFFQPLKLKKGDYFLKEEQYVRQIGFVEKGILREYLYLKDKEVTKWFSTKGNFAVDLSGFLYNQKSRVNYQALCDSELWTLSRENYERIANEVSRWDKLEKMFVTKCFIILENRLISLLALSAEERYKQFFELNAQLFNQVPHNCIASMLAMTPETLSRIRNKSRVIS